MTTDTMVSTGEIFSGVTTSLPILEDMPILNAASKNSIVPTGEVQVLQDQTG